jgi:L-ascorbate metabolism protein UlaG (beta-lactamase superfamily)
VESSVVLQRPAVLNNNQHMASTLDLYGCATFRFKTAGLTIFLDAYIDRVPDAAGTGLTADDIDECDWIVVGHSHFDHLWGAERIAANTGAKIICSYESVRVMEQAGVPVDQMICVAGGETIDLGNGVKVSVYPSQHSCVWSHAQMDQPDHVCIGDLGVTWQEQQERMAELMTYLSTETGPEVIEHIVAGAPGHSDRGDGGALVFVFETPDGSLFYQDTSGHWSGVLRDLRPDVAIVGAAGRGNIDGEPIQGSLAQFVARQVDILRPKTVILGHHDDWLPGFSVPTDTAPIREELSRVAPNTTMLEMGYLEGVEVL